MKGHEEHKGRQFARQFNFQILGRHLPFSAESPILHSPRSLLAPQLNALPLFSFVSFVVRCLILLTAKNNSGLS